MAKKSAATEPKVSVVPIESLTPDPENVRLHPERNKKAVAASLRRFGAGRSIVLDRNDKIVAGNETVNSASANGFTEVLVIEPKPGQLVAVKRSGWTKAEAMGYAIADNQTATSAEFDNPALLGQIEALELDGIDFETLGFSDEEMDELKIDFTERTPEPRKDAQPITQTTYECPECGHQWSKEK